MSDSFRRDLESGEFRTERQVVVYPASEEDAQALRRDLLTENESPGSFSLFTLGGGAVGLALVAALVAARRVAP